MSANGEFQRPDAAAKGDDRTTDRAPSEQTFFTDPALDRLMGIAMALASEVYVLRSRFRQLERALEDGGMLPAAIGEPSAEQTEAERRDADDFVAHILQATLGEQQARGMS